MDQMCESMDKNRIQGVSVGAAGNLSRGHIHQGLAEFATFAASGCAVAAMENSTPSPGSTVGAGSASAAGW